MHRPSPYSHTSSIRPNRRTRKTTARPEWSRANHIDKLAEAYIQIERLGGKVFTLRLSKDAHNRIVASKDPCRTVYRRIQKAFRDRAPEVPLIAYFLEVTPDYRNELHIHGAIVPGASSMVDIKQALRVAGGVIKGPAAPRQVDVKCFDLDRGGPVGWAHYPKKALARTRRTIGQNRVTYIDARLRRLCQKQWAQHRASFSAAKSPYTAEFFFSQASTAATTPGAFMQVPLRTALITD